MHNGGTRAEELHAPAERDPLLSKGSGAYVPPERERDSVSSQHAGSVGMLAKVRSAMLAVADMPCLCAATDTCSPAGAELGRWGGHAHAQPAVLPHECAQVGG